MSQCILRQVFFCPKNTRIVCSPLRWNSNNVRQLSLSRPIQTQTIKGDRMTNYKRSTARLKAKETLHRYIDVTAMFGKENAISPDDTSTNEREEKTIQKQTVEFKSAEMTTFLSKLTDYDGFLYSKEQWKQFEQTVKTENPKLEKTWGTKCMQLMYGYGCVKLASTLMEFLNSEGRSPNITTLALYIALQGTYGSEDKESIIMETFKKVKEISDLFDSITAKYLITGISETSHWKIGLDILEMAKLTSNIGTALCSPIIAAAIRENQHDLAFKLLDDMVVQEIQPQLRVLHEVLEACKKVNDHDLLERYLACFKNYGWILSMDEADELDQYFTQSSQEKWTCKWTALDRARGFCPACRHDLEQIELSSDDFEAMQRELLGKVLVGSNIYFNSNPEEVKRFQEFIMEHAPFDIVFDALNIAYKGQGYQGSSVQARQLCNMVRHFARNMHMKVLVVGRAYMKKKWPAKDMDQIASMAHIFLTDNPSADDPFSLCAAFYSGRDCLLLSRDFLRNHKFNLGPEFKDAFERWQKTRQIMNFQPGREKIHFLMPNLYDCGPTKDENGWHIPYNDGSIDFSSTKQAALCLRSKGLRTKGKK